MRIEELILEGIADVAEAKVHSPTSCRLQVVSGEDANNGMGSVVQRHYRSKWLGKVKHPRCDLLCARNNEHAISTMAS